MMLVSLPFVLPIDLVARGALRNAKDVVIVFARIDLTHAFAASSARRLAESWIGAIPTHPEQSKMLVDSRRRIFVWQYGWLVFPSCDFVDRSIFRTKGTIREITPGRHEKPWPKVSQENKNYEFRAPAAESNR